MNKDMIEEQLKHEVNELAKGVAFIIFIGFMAGAITAFFLMGGWSKYMPGLRLWLIQLSIDASVWLQSVGSAP